MARSPLPGKIVIDTNTHCPRRDGQIAELRSTPSGDPERSVLAIPGEDAGRQMTVDFLRDDLDAAVRYADI